MGAAIKSEFRKFFTTRLWWGMAIGIFIAGAVFSGFFAWLMTSEGVASGSPQESGMPVGSPTQVANSVYTAGLGVGYLLMLTIGVLQIGSEYRHKTISGTFLATPKRLQAMLAKVVALLGIGAIYGVISLLGSVSVGATVLSLRNHNAFPSTEVLRTIVLSLLVLGLWALIGLGIGILIPNQVAALLIGVGVAWIVEPLLGLILSIWSWGADIAKFLPSQATNAIVNSVTQGGMSADRLSWWAGSLTLAAWAAVLAGFGIWRTSRQDIT
jgi:ABC-2 type transport system permease protein